MHVDNPAESEQWPILKTLHWTVDYFNRHALDSPRIDAEILLAHALGCERIDLYMRHDQPLNADELSVFKGLIRRRAVREPVAYITGIKEFWSLPFQVTPAVLIPRPDTERLVEMALSLLNEGDFGDRARILELGVGSGAVTVALAHEYKSGRFWALDRSWPAVCVARHNAGRNGVDHRIHFFIGDWMASLASDCEPFDMIVTNPPYVRTADIDTLSDDIRRFEPVTALDGGQDGMDAIRIILEQSHRHLRRGGVLLTEIGHDQREAVSGHMQRRGIYQSVEFFKDYGGNDRVAVLRR